MHRRLLSTISSLIFLSLVAINNLSAQENASQNILPTDKLQDYLSGVKSSEGERSSRVIDFKVKKIPEDSVYAAAAAEHETGISQPFQSANELLILLQPGLTEEEIESALSDHNLTAIDAHPQIGSITVDASARLDDSAGSSFATVTEVENADINKLINELSKDPRFIQVAPNTIITPFAIKSVVKVDIPSEGMVAAAAGEEVDWGIEDGKFSQFWPRLNNEIPIGVIDVGFADHVDLDTVPALPHEIPVNNHGNHVAGIICAQHNDIGVKGALNHCKTFISAGSSFFDSVSPIEDPGLLGFHTRFSELISTVLDFIEQNSSVKTINLSLGYNWMPNFGIDPRDSNNAQIRDLVRGQGRFFTSILAFAKNRDVAIVSAAGNDSRTLPTPLPAIWASPFNFGSSMIEDLDGWTNGLVVEAHDINGNRAVFSNNGGHISCPGVDVLSTLAVPSNSYGRMSGTSMASPYCAAALAALRELRTDLTLRESIDCLRASPDLIENRVPRLNLDHAVNQC